jgi:hypothetical protein
LLFVFAVVFVVIPQRSGGICFFEMVPETSSSALRNDARLEAFNLHPDANAGHVPSKTAHS